MFEAVMQKDNAEATRTSINGTELNLSDAEQLFKALQASAVRTTHTHTDKQRIHTETYITCIDGIWPVKRRGSPITSSLQKG